MFFAKLKVPIDLYSLCSSSIADDEVDQSSIKMSSWSLEALQETRHWATKTPPLLNTVKSATKEKETGKHKVVNKKFTSTAW